MNNQVQITVFTPTFNRGSLLRNLYESLVRQTYLPKEWIIVDDGSSDDTSKIVRGFIEEKKINILYFLQENGGKHRAINRGVAEANGELFFIVDSDDYLSDDALEQVAFYWQSIPVSDRDSFAGVGGLRITPDFQVIGNLYPCSSEHFIDATYWDMRNKYNVRGDRAEIYRTFLLRQYPFPEFTGEKFVTEDTVWGRLSQEGYRIRWFNKGIYFCEYLPGGLTSRYERLLTDNPLGSAYFYNQEQCSPSPHWLFLNYRYYCYSFLSKENIFCAIRNDNRKFLSIVGLPLGAIRFLSEKIKRKRVNK